MTQDTYTVLRALSRDITAANHGGGIEKRSFWKGLWQAGKAAWNASSGARTAAAKDAFTAATKGKGLDNAYDVGRVLWHTPNRAIGSLIWGDWGAAHGLTFLGRRLFRATGEVGKDGKWVFNPNLAKPGELPWYKRVGNKLYEWGKWGDDWTNRSAAKAIESGNRIASRGGAGNYMLGKGLRWGTSVGIGGTLIPMGATIGTEAAFGKDSLIAKGADKAEDALMVPFLYGNPIGWAFTGLSKGLEYGSNAIENTVKTHSLAAAEQAARETASSIAQGVQDKGRLAFMYGAVSPEAYAAKLKDEANNKITERIAAKRRELGMNS